jgi:putative transposase
VFKTKGGEMTRPAVTHIRDSLTSLISPQLIRRRARSLGVVKRQRKVDVVALVYALVLGFERGAKRSLASFRRAYCSSTGVTLAPSAFYGRFTPELAELMKQLTTHAFEHLNEGTSRLQRTLAAFAKVFIADGSLVRLHPNLQDDYPSVWTNHTKAGAKLHVTIDGASRTPQILSIVPGSKHDVTLLNVGPWSKDALLVFDLAYYQGKLFRQILDHGGHFLCRVKKDANFVILAAKKSRWVGLKHKEVLSEMHGKTFEVEVDYVYRHIPEGEWLKRHLRLRLIAVWRQDIGQHRLYLTSTDPSQLKSDTAPAVYALRWEIELLFRELKSQLKLEEMPSGNKSATECLIYAALLTLAIGRKLLRMYKLKPRPRNEAVRSYPTERWTTVLRSLMPQLLALMLGPIRARAQLERLLEIVLRREAPDPNRSRMLLLERAQSGVLQHDLAAA